VPHSTRYLVTEALLQYWKGRYGSVPSCRLCDRELVEGDVALGRSLHRSGFNARRYYHVQCFDEGSVPRTPHPRGEAS